MNSQSVVMILLASVLIGPLNGCVVGPDYQGPPQIEKNNHFARVGEVFENESSTQRSVRWWLALEDTTLDKLIGQALRGSPGIAVAEARVRQARASLRGEKANLLPSADASLSGARIHLPKESMGDVGAARSSTPGAHELKIPSSINLFSADFDASWELDLFGGQQRAVEAARASAEAAQERLADVQLSLTAEVAQAYVNLRTAQTRLGLSNKAIERQQRQIELTEHSLQGGTASEVDILRLQNQLETTRSQTEPLLAQVELYLDELAVLTGLAPGALDDHLAIADSSTPAIPLPPASLSVVDPATMLRQRPDIRAAERTLASSQAQIGQAMAARFPSVSLFGVIGIGGAHAHDLTRLDDFTSVVAPRLSWNIFDFGRASANIHEAEGARDEAEAQFRSTVLSALEDAEDSLVRFRHGRASVAIVARSRNQAARAAELMAIRQQAGTAALIDVLDTERQQLSAEQNLAQAEGSLTNDFIALQKSLGLGLGKSKALTPSPNDELSRR